MDLSVRLYTGRIDCESLLEDHGVHITGVRISAKTEISQAVHNILTFVFLNSLEYVGMVAYYQVCAFVDSHSAQLGLIAVRRDFFFGSPVKDGDDKLSAVFF